MVSWQIALITFYGLPFLCYSLIKRKIQCHVYNAGLTTRYRTESS